ncbi:hypothetical protein BKN14_00305 [Candidatus Gracilibacteria bacterium HOT-871]|nr:hypothetical protein BKN14_00305 [Candidatus Gracilibacteria bacterium HOT-871]
MEKFNLEKYDFKRNLLFSGKPGVGKTYLAREILQKYKSRRYEKILDKYEISDAYFKQLVKTNSLKLRLPEDYAVSLEFYPLEIMMRCEVLLYDDVGVSDVTEAYLRDFTFILDERKKRGLVTIFTTNLKKVELQEKLNERIVSRLLDDCDVVVFSGEDRRQKTTRYFNL